MSDETTMSANQSTSERLRADYVNQLNGVNTQLTNLETERQRLVSYREQLKGAIFALDQLNSLGSGDTATTASSGMSAASSGMTATTDAASAAS